MLYGVFGNPVKQSKSPEIHQMFAAQTDTELQYIKIKAPVKGFADAAKTFAREGGKGFNVTLPFKEEAYTLMDESSPRAKRAEAVNTVLVDDEQGFFGDNTDGPGLINDLKHNLGWTLADASVLIIGAGGAVKGVLGSLIDEKPGRIVIANRTPARAESLVRAYDNNLCSTQALNELKETFDLVINGTSASLGGKVPAIPSSVMGPRTRCYDMVYMNGETVFNRWSLAQGAMESRDGLGMLIEQAALAFELWTGIKPNTQDVISHLQLH